MDLILTNGFGSRAISHIVQNYAIACSDINHVHTLANCETTLKNMEQRNLLIDTILLILNGVMRMNPYFTMVLGGGISLLRMYGLSHRIRYDCDFEVANMKQVLAQKDKTSQFVNFCQTVRQALSEYHIIDNGGFVDGIKKTCGFKIAVGTEYLCIDMVYYSNRYFTLTQTTNICCLPNASLNTIIAGKLFQFVSVSRVLLLNHEYHKIKVKIFYDIYVWSLSYEFTSELRSLFYEFTNTHRLTNKYYDFYNNPDPIQSIIDIINELETQPILLKKEYDTFLSNEVYACTPHNFEDTCKTMTIILKNLLRVGGIPP